jgi:hypothetical protein
MSNSKEYDENHPVNWGVGSTILPWLPEMDSWMKRLRLSGSVAPFDFKLVIVSVLLAFVLNTVLTGTRKLRRQMRASPDPKLDQTSEIVPTGTAEYVGETPAEMTRGSLFTSSDEITLSDDVAESTKAPIQNNTADHGEDSERDADVNVAHGKRKVPRRRRGKKKKGNNVPGVVDEVEEEEERLPNGGTIHEPELQAEESTSPVPATPKTPLPVFGSSLEVSDTILGMCFIY